MPSNPKVQYTRGPWRVERYGLDGDPLAITAGHGTGEHIVARIAGFSRVNEAEDAHLIAAAPDMLSALKAIVARIDGRFDDPNLKAAGPLGSTAFDIARIADAAIVKAEGGSK